MASFSAILSDGSEYVKEGLIEKWQRWIVLIILLAVQMFTLSVVPLFNGYLVRVYGSTSGVAPEADDYKRLFIDGWRLNIVTILYMIPAVIVGVVLGLMTFVPELLGHVSTGRMDKVAGLILGASGLMVAGLVLAVITLIMYMAFVHFSRSGNLIDAFNVGAITRKVSEGIGWGTYVLMWVIIWIISMTLFIIVIGLSSVPPLGFIIGMVLAPLWAVFIAKITCNIYDNRP